jgi:hypothetical protein
MVEVHVYLAICVSILLHMCDTDFKIVSVTVQENELNLLEAEATIQHYVRPLPR